MPNPSIFPLLKSSPRGLRKHSEVAIKPRTLTSKNEDTTAPLAVYPNASVARIKTFKILLAVKVSIEKTRARSPRKLEQRVVHAVTILAN